MNDAEVGDDGDVRSHRRHQPGDVATAPRPHLDHQVLRIVAGAENGERNTDLVVVRLGRRCSVRQSRREQILRRGLPRRTGDRDHRDDELIPAGRGEIAQRHRSVGDLDPGLHRVPGLDQHRGGAGAQGVARVGVAVLGFSPHGNEERPRPRLPRVGDDARDPHRGVAEDPAPGGRGDLGGRPGERRDLGAGSQSADLLGGDDAVIEGDRAGGEVLARSRAPSRGSARHPLPRPQPRRGEWPAVDRARSPRSVPQERRTRRRRRWPRHPPTGDCPR